MLQQLNSIRPLVLILLHTECDEFLKLFAPLVFYGWRRLVQNLQQHFFLLLDFEVGWLAVCQLDSKHAVRPDVH